MPLNPARVRIQTGSETVGSITNLSTSETDIARTTLFWQRTEDTVGFLQQDNYFDTEIRDHKSVGTVSGEPDAFPVFRMIDYPYGSQGLWDHCILPPSTSDVEAATQAVARTNPSRAIVSMPAFIGELRSLPGAIFDRGMSLLAKYPKRARRSNSVVDFNFGFAPLIGDLYRLVYFSTYVDDRVKELTNLHKKGGLHRRWNLETDAGDDVVENVAVWTLEGAWVEVTITRHTHRRRWATCRWLPDVPELALSPADLREQAKFAVNGWNLSMADAWEILPWSWLADYFGNVGDYLLANRNAVGASCSSACIMTSIWTDTSHSVTMAPSWLKVSPASEYYATKHRQPNVPVGLTIATSPFLGARQLLTLASIAYKYR